MATDARIRYTKMIIQVNFISLLKKKPINKITVKEICELAEINRATFYKYFFDAYDLMDKIEKEILKELQETVQQSIKYGVQKTILMILEKMKENGELYITLFSGNGDTNFPIKIFQLCYAEISEYINAHFSNLTQKQRAWVYVYIAQGSSGILQYWITDGMKDTPQMIAEFIENLISNTVSNIK